MMSMFTEDAKGDQLGKKINTATRVRRLQKLRDYMSTIPPKKFDMRIWCEAVLNGVTKQNATVKELREGSCGTVACLAGYTALLFSKPSEKLVMDAVPYYADTKETIADRARKVLGLDHETASLLFGGDWTLSLNTDYPTNVQLKRHALKVLDGLIANKGASIPQQFLECRR